MRREVKGRGEGREERWSKGGEEREEITGGCIYGDSSSRLFSTFDDS